MLFDKIALLYLVWCTALRSDASAQQASHFQIYQDNVRWRQTNKQTENTSKNLSTMTMLRSLLVVAIAVCGDGLAFGVGRDRQSQGGGRAPGKADVLSTTSSSTSKWQPVAPNPSEAKLTIVQVTDVYTLEHFASLKTLLAQAKEQSAPGKVISMLTGDFLAPYLLSSVDRGAGMMNAISKVPIDYVTWGNHEADIDHRNVCRHVRNFPGTWLNTNMQDHEAMESQQPFDIVEVTSPDGTNTRRIGLVAVLSNDPGLYSHFKPPGESEECRFTP